MSERIPKNFESAEKIKGEFERLKTIHSILTEMGFTVWEFATSFENFKELWKEEKAFPLVDDGANGIRAIPHKDRGLVVTFTNEYEEPDDPIRQKVEERLKAEGLGNR